MKNSDNNMKEMNNIYDLMDDNNEYSYNNEEYFEDQKNIKKITFIVHFYFNINEKEFLFQVESSILKENQYVYELIIDVVNKFNILNKEIILNNKRYYISLKSIDNLGNEDNLYKYNYILKPAKKNYKPKNDMPCYSYKSILGDIKNERICFVCDNKENILLNEIINDEYNDKICYENKEEYIEKPKIKINKNSFSKNEDRSYSHNHCIIF